MSRHAYSFFFFFKCGVFIGNCSARISNQLTNGNRITSFYLRSAVKYIVELFGIYLSIYISIHLSIYLSIYLYKV